jgi:hypothetical protein
MTPYVLPNGNLMVPGLPTDPDQPGVLTDGLIEVSPRDKGVKGELWRVWNDYLTGLGEDLVTGPEV